MAKSSWGVSPYSSENSVELVYRTETNAPLSLYCADRDCSMIVEPRSGCSLGSVYPLLLNSATQVGISPSTCVRVGGRDASRPMPRTGLLIGPGNEFVAGLFVGDSLSVAFPETAGGMEVLDIEATGLAEAFASALQAHRSDEESNARPHEGQPSAATKHEAVAAWSAPFVAGDAAIAKALQASTTEHWL